MNTLNILEHALSMFTSKGIRSGTISGWPQVLDCTRVQNVLGKNLLFLGMYFDVLAFFEKSIHFLNAILYI